MAPVAKGGALDLSVPAAAAANEVISEIKVRHSCSNEEGPDWGLTGWQASWDGSRVGGGRIELKVCIADRIPYIPMFKYCTSESITRQTCAHASRPRSRCGELKIDATRSSLHRNHDRST